MAVSLKPSHLKRYKDIAVLLVKYGRGGAQADPLSPNRPELLR